MQAVVCAHYLAPDCDESVHPTQCAIPHVLDKLAQGLHFLWPTVPLQVPTASAICVRRYQVEVHLLVPLFQQICQPMAT